MKKTLLSTAVAAAIGMSASAAQAFTVTIVWADNVAPSNPYPSPHAVGFSDPNLANSFSAFNEFRVLVPDPTAPATAGGGEKSIVGDSKITGAGKATTLPHNFVTWNFSVTGNHGSLTSVANTDMTPGANYYAAGCGYIVGTCTNNSAAPGGDVGLFKNAGFLGAPFGFLAPTVGSAAATAYGAASIWFDSTDNFTMLFPVLEAQWNQGYFTLGLASDPVTGTGYSFACTGAISGNIACTSSHQIQASEDSLGFAGTVTQFDLVGAMTPPHIIPVPAAVWLFGSGLLGLVGVARRKRIA